MVKAKIRGLDGRVNYELRRVVADEHDRVRRFYKRVDWHGHFTPAREAGLKRRRDRRAAARAELSASAVQAVQEEARPSPARSSSEETIIVPPAMYVRDPAASAERRSLSVGMVRCDERRSSPTFPVMSVPETPPRRSAALDEEEEDPRSLADLEGLHVVVPPRQSDFDFNTLVAELVSSAFEQNFHLGDEVNLLKLFPSLNPVQSPLRTFMSDIILRTIFSGAEQVRYLTDKYKERQQRRLLQAGEAWERLNARHLRQLSSSSPSSSSSELSDYGCISARDREVRLVAVAAAALEALAERAGRRGGGRGVRRGVVARRRGLSEPVVSCVQW